MSRKISMVQGPLSSEEHHQKNHTLHLRRRLMPRTTKVETLYVDVRRIRRPVARDEKAILDLVWLMAKAA